MELCSEYDKDVVAGAGVCRIDCICGGAAFEEGVMVGLDTLRTCSGDADCDLSNGGAPATVWRIVIAAFIGGRESGFVGTSG